MKDLGDTIKIHFLGTILKIYLTMLDGLVHFHVIFAVVDFRLPCKWRAPLTASSSLATGGINPSKASN